MSHKIYLAIGSVAAVACDPVGQLSAAFARVTTITLIGDIAAKAVRPIEPLDGQRDAFFFQGPPERPRCAIAAAGAVGDEYHAARRQQHAWRLAHLRRRRAAGNDYSNGGE